DASHPADAQSYLSLVASAFLIDVKLAIDNFEHLLDASGFIHHLLENTPSLKIIVTSRETLRLSHEFVYSLRGLAVPPATASVSEIAAYPSVRLFVNKSLQGRQNFDPDFSKIAEICRLIDGNPLAIDLAAVWTKVLDTDAILAEIQSCVDFLESNLRDAPERHRSIRAVFTGSWQLLTPAEQDVLKRLSIFKDKFTREAAQVVVDANLRTLLALRDKSLLTVYDNGFYCLHSLVQQLAYEYLIADSAVANETREKYLSYYADLTAQLRDALCGSEQASALETMQHAIHNIRVAWAWSVEHQRVDLIDKFLLGIALYFEMRSQTHEGASLLTIAPHLLSQLPDAVRARIQLLLGWQSIIMWQNEKGTRLIKEAVALLDDYPRWFGMALVPAMNHPELLGDAYSGLFAHIESELNTADDTWQRAWLLKAIGEYYYVSHDYEVATDNLQQSANHFEQAGDAWGIAWAYGNLGRAFIHMEKYQAAEAIYEDSIAICQRLNDVTGWIDIINKQAELALAQMQLTKAETILYGGFQIAHENDSPTGVYTYLLFTLAKARIEQERY
ncbi:MAG: tetratricopeptide repeat protein, partial [Chloroflexota bacterium]